MIKEALEFTTDRNSCREFIRTPFVQRVNGRLAVNASDGYILLSVYRDITDLVKEYDERKRPDCDKLYKSLNLDLGIKKTISVEAIEKILQKVERNVVVEYEDECDECLGSGLVEWRYEDSNGFLHVKESGCPICNESGVVHNEVVEPFDKHTVICIGQCYFSAVILDKTAKILSKLSVTSIDCVVFDDRMLLQNEDFSLIVMGEIRSFIHEEVMKIIRLE